MIKTKYTQKLLAKKLGVSQATIHNWLSLTHKPTGLQRESLERKNPELLKKIDDKWKLKEI